MVNRSLIEPFEVDNCAWLVIGNLCYITMTTCTVATNNIATDFIAIT